jgi:hypothetical protein
VGLFGRPRFSRTRSGDFKVRLAPGERELLQQLQSQLDALLRSDMTGPTTVRLFPTAYPGDAARNEEYQRLMRDELIQRRLDSVAMLERTADAEQLTEEELGAWVRVLNDARLVLGTILDVSEDSDVLDIEPDAEDASERVAYVVLSAIVEEGVIALSGALPPPSR